MVEKNKHTYQYYYLMGILNLGKYYYKKDEYSKSSICLEFVKLNTYIVKQVVSCY